MSRLVTLALLISGAPTLFGGVTLDGSFGTHGALPGPNFIIPASVGKQVGSNLFQSFSQFNLISSESATFSGPNNVQNILSRVTSGSPSSIDGKVSSQIQGANLFFINPAGVIFGPHAQLDVSGSVAVTTANYVKLVGGGRFNANLGGQDTLSSAPVASFGFLNSAPASIFVVGNNDSDSNGNATYAPSLNIAAGKSFSFIAGGIGMSGGKITGEGSRMNLVSVHSAGEVILDATDINSSVDTSQFGVMGAIALINLANIDASGTAGGPVVVRGGSLVLDNSQIGSETTGAIQGGPMDIALLGDLKVVDGAAIFTNALGSGNGGNLSIHAASVLINGSAMPNQFTGISAGTATGATGDAGDLNIRVDQTLSIMGHGQIGANTFSSGNGGNLSVHAGSLSIDGSATPHLFTGIAADTFDTGDAGNLTITVDTLLRMVGRGQISANTLSSGKGGNISIHAASLSINGVATPNEFTGIGVDSEQGATGDAGDLTIMVDQALSIVGHGQIGANTRSSGNGGNLTIDAGSLLIDGSATRFRFTGIGAESNHVATGNAGDITINVGEALKIVGSGLISAVTASSGNGGNITIHAGSLSIDGSATPDRNTYITAESLQGATGDAGNVDVTIDHALKIAGHGSIFDGTSSSGHGGDLLIHAGSLSINGAATPKKFTGISVESKPRATGDAGSIEISSSGTIKLTHHSSITASSNIDGGNITIKAPTLVYLIDSKITAEAGSTGGNITIDPIFIALNNSRISANASAGQGGNINLISDFFFNSNSSVTATGTTNNGTVNITAPELDLGAELITLPSSLVSAENQLQERCTALLQGDFSSFISIGRGGTEPEPEELESGF